MDKVTQSSAASAEELNAQAMELKGVVGQLMQLIGGKADEGATSHSSRSHSHGQ